ncbi:MAG: ABC transporter permease [Mycoplasmatales bacterium]
MSFKKYKYLLGIVVKGLLQNILRTILTIITNIIGMTAILVVIISASSLSNNFERQTEDSSIISFIVSPKSFSDQQTNVPEKYNINQQQLENIRKQVKGVEKLNYRENNAIDDQSFEVGNPKVFEGENFSNQTGNVIVMVENEFTTQTTNDDEKKAKAKINVGDELTLKGVKYKIIGKTREGFSSYIIPEYLKAKFVTPDYTTIEATIKGTSNYSEQVQSLKTQLTNYITPQQEIIEIDLNSITRDVINVVTIFFAAIGSVSLIVSLVAIINMLFVSVNERKSKIAILRALGMQKADISMMFVIESLLIVLFSTIISFGFASLITLLLLQLASISLYISFGWLIFTVLFAIILSVIAAVLPAFAAARTNISIILR